MFYYSGVFEVLLHEFMSYFCSPKFLKVEQLQKASLKDPVLLEISSGVLTAEKLQQYFILVPQSTKDACLLYLVRSRFFGKAIIIFTPTWKVMNLIYTSFSNVFVDWAMTNGKSKYISLPRTSQLKFNWKKRNLKQKFSKTTCTLVCSSLIAYKLSAGV